MTFLLTEISIKDAYQRWYSYIKPEVYEEILKASQPNIQNFLHPYTKWVFSLYKKNPNMVMNQLHLLNNEQGTGALQVFNRIGPDGLKLLNGRDADLYSYSSIYDLYTLTSTFNIEDLNGDNAERKKKIMRPEFIAARNDINRLYEDNEWLVISPNSYEASVYWGHGTSWCTAYKDQRTYYDSYSRQGRLYINIDKRDGSKFQFHFESNSFMDEYDHKIDNPIFENMEATPSLIDFYEEELTPTNFEKLSENPNLYDFVESLNDR